MVIIVIVTMVKGAMSAIYEDFKLRWWKWKGRNANFFELYWHTKVEKRGTVEHNDEIGLSIMIYLLFSLRIAP